MNEGDGQPKCDDVFAENEKVGEVSHQGTLMLEPKQSISENAEFESRGRLTAPSWLSWLEYPFRVRNPSSGNQLKEATGWSMDAVGRGIINQTGSFLGPALLRSAFAEAECKSADCTNTVYGLKPSSLLTFTASIVGIIAAIALPFVGAIVDHTRHRKTLGSISGAIIVVITGMQISITQNNWFFILILESIGAFFTLVHIVVVYAYLSDFTTLESDLAHLTSRFNIIQYIGQFVFVAIVVVVAEIEDVDTSVESTVDTSRQSSCIAFAVSIILIPYSWLFLFRKRPALSDVPEGANLLTAGFVKVGKTSKTIWRKYHALKWFMISLLASPESGAGTVLTITATFLTVQLNLTSQEIGYVTLTFFFFTLPGALLSKWLCHKINPLNTYRASLSLLGAASFGTCLSLSGPDVKNGIYPWVAIWGIAIGCIYPSQRVLLCTLIPKGQETELMGLFTFCGQILGWLPPVIFTAMNQRGVNMQWSAQVISVICVLAVILTLPMGSYQKAVRAVACECGTETEDQDQSEKIPEASLDEADIGDVLPA